MLRTEKEIKAFLKNIEWQDKNIVTNGDIKKVLKWVLNDQP